MLDKIGIAQRIAKEVKDRYYVNLGIGIPTLVANYINKDNYGAVENTVKGGGMTKRKWKESPT